MEQSIIHLSELLRLGIDIIVKRTPELITASISQQEIVEQQLAAPLPVQQKDEPDDLFKQRLQDYWVLFLAQFSFQELLIFNSSSQMKLRAEISKDPFVRNCQAYQGAENIDIFSNNRISPNRQDVSIRTRSFEFTPVGSLLFFVCGIIAMSQEARVYINSNATPDGETRIPRFFHEQLLNDRFSNCADWRITTEIVSLPRTVLQVLDLENTIVDLQYLLTQQGISALFGFFARLNTYPELYIEMVPFTKPIMMESGNTTTATALYCSDNVTQNKVERDVTFVKEAVDDKGNKTTIKGTYKVEVPKSLNLSILGGHSYGANLNGVHCVDALVLVRRLKIKGVLYTKDGNSLPIIPLIPQGNTSLYVIKRITELANKPPKSKSNEGAPKDLDDDNSSPPTKSPPYKPRGKQGSSNKQQQRGKASPKEEADNNKITALADVLIQFLRSVGYKITYSYAT